MQLPRSEDRSDEGAACVTGDNTEFEGELSNNIKNDDDDDSDISELAQQFQRQVNFLPSLIQEDAGAGYPSPIAVDSRSTSPSGLGERRDATTHAAPANLILSLSGAINLATDLNGRASNSLSTRSAATLTTLPASGAADPTGANNSSSN